MQRLGLSLLNGDFQFPADLLVQAHAAPMPERVIQFGEGNFLRGFVDWMFHLLNKQGLFNGRVVVVQPIRQGMGKVLNEQDGLYTLLLRGRVNGKVVEEKEIIRSISRCIDPYTQWKAYLACAEDPHIEYVVSNTTEAGIVFDPADRLENTPPDSFPGKLAAYLYHRFEHFRGDRARGMIVIPCELIDRNGDNLKRAILQLAEQWKLPAAFSRWIDQHNVFLNTLVDRVVTGYPRDEIAEITAALGYEDTLLVAGELFHLWVIEGPEGLAERLPFDKAGLQVVWTSDLAPHRTKKVRILNGAHTAGAPVAFLYGLDTVREMITDGTVGEFVKGMIADEIVPSMNLDRALLSAYARDVIERFANPFVKHYLSSILLNSSSKFRARVLPSMLDYYRAGGELPRKLSFALAAMLSLYRGGTMGGGTMTARRDKGAFAFRDDLWALEYLSDCWQRYDGSQASARKVATRVLQNAKLWGRDLASLGGWAEGVGDALWGISTKGIGRALSELPR